MSTAVIIALCLGAIIIAGLAFYAGQLLYKLSAQKKLIAKKQAEQKQKLAASRLKRNAKLADSIHLIARAMKEEQCEFSEGCLRVWVLMSQYGFGRLVNNWRTSSFVSSMWLLFKRRILIFTGEECFINDLATSPPSFEISASEFTRIVPISADLLERSTSPSRFI